MINYEHALNILLNQVPLLDTEIVHLNDALGRVCADTMMSPEAMPAFANSAMDGYAIQTASLKNCSSINPVYLTVIDTIAAGDAPASKPTNSQQACEIMTGAVIPEGFDAVIPIEAVSVIDNKKIMINQTLEPGQNIRYPGEDFQVNDLVLSAGEIIEPRHIMILASLGITQISVYRPIKIMILSTGNELVSVDTKQLAIGQVRNSNGIYLAHALQSPSIDAKFLGSFSDDLIAVKNKIVELLEADSVPDMIITTGAVSAGKWDFIPTLLNELKANILFHKVAIRPGKPILAGKLSEQTYFFGLPGNPISTAVGLRFFVKPLLRSMQGQTLETPLLAKLINPIHKKHGLHTFYKAYGQVNQSGELVVDFLSGQESFKMKPLLSANCWAVLTDAKEYQQHELIKIYQDI